jgi:hypothetical protein
MESHSTLRSLTDSWFAAHISSILAAMAPRWGRTACGVQLRFLTCASAWRILPGLWNAVYAEPLPNVSAACLRGYLQTLEELA